MFYSRVVGLKIMGRLYAKLAYGRVENYCNLYMQVEMGVPVCICICVFDYV